MLAVTFNSPFVGFCRLPSSLSDARFSLLLRLYRIYNFLYPFVLHSQTSSICFYAAAWQQRGHPGRSTSHLPRTMRMKAVAQPQACMHLDQTPSSPLLSHKADLHTPPALPKAAFSGAPSPGPTAGFPQGWANL